MASTIRVLLVEDHLPVRRALARAIDASSSARVVAEAATVAESRRIIAGASTFDVALVDLGLGDGSGIDVIRELRAARPAVAAIALTVIDAPEVVHEAIVAGASGYLLKGADAKELVSAIVRAHDGGAPLSPEIARSLLDRYRAQSPHVDRRTAEDQSGLTARELDVLRLLCEGHSYASVAGNLAIGIGTVQTHVKSIYGKMSVVSKAELASVARRRGMI